MFLIDLTALATSLSCVACVSGRAGRLVGLWRTERELLAAEG